MSEKVSKSETGQNQVPPTREERDKAYSAGGGRMADEEPKNNLDLNPEGQEALSPPVGLDMETRGDDLETETQADEEWAEGLYEDVADEAPEHSQSAAGASGDTDELPDERHIAD